MRPTYRAVLWSYTWYLSIWDYRNNLNIQLAEEENHLIQNDYYVRINVHFLRMFSLSGDVATVAAVFIFTASLSVGYTFKLTIFKAHVLQITSFLEQLSFSSSMFFVF